jgi:hypothetical protein
MKKTEQGVIKPGRDTMCDRCENTFRQCPMILVMAQQRVPQGMEIEVKTCPEFRPKKEDDQ